MEWIGERNMRTLKGREKISGDEGEYAEEEEKEMRGKDGRS